MSFQFFREHADIKLYESKDTVLGILRVLVSISVISIMVIGRAGTLTITYLLGEKLISTNYKYPYAETMVG